MYFFLQIFVVIFAATSVVGHNLTESEILAFKPPEIILKNLPYYLSGNDEEGSPIWVFELGHWDMRKFVEEGGGLYNAMDIHVDQMFITFRDTGLNSTGKQFVGICDMEGFNIRQAGHAGTVQFILSKFARFQQIAAGGGFKGGWFVNCSLSALMEVYGTNNEVWIPKILRKISKDQLPEWYGGVKGHKPKLWMG